MRWDHGLLARDLGSRKIDLIDDLLPYDQHTSRFCVVNIALTPTPIYPRRRRGRDAKTSTSTSDLESCFFVDRYHLHHYYLALFLGNEVSHDGNFALSRSQSCLEHPAEHDRNERNSRQTSRRCPSAQPTPTETRYAYNSVLVNRHPEFPAQTPHPRLLLQAVAEDRAYRIGSSLGRARMDVLSPPPT